MLSSEKNRALQEVMLSELRAIGDWWEEHTPDNEYGGFVGEIDLDNRATPEASKGVILNTRILWFFSEAAMFTGERSYRELADRAFGYIAKNFVDPEHGGVYWELSHSGKPLNTRKQVYAQAFAIYAFSAYYRLTHNFDALGQARFIFELLESRCKEPEYGGYLEAFSREWGSMDDVRLSPKDMNCPKSMNTHLHILEAYTALQLAAPSEDVAEAIRYCLDIFDQQIINKDTWHLRMFHGVDWTDISDAFSFGHDIESSWLIWEAVETLHDPALTARYRDTVLAIAATTLKQGLGSRGEVFDAYSFKTKAVLQRRVWWVQAEALIGFMMSYSLSGAPAFLDAALNVWEFIQAYQKDKENGEWYWLSTLDRPHVGDCKVGFWKAPYHNGRAMMETISLLRKLESPENAGTPS